MSSISIPLKYLNATVQVQRTCEACHGERTVIDSDWAAFNAWHDAIQKERRAVPELEESLAWWRARGFDAVTDLWENLPLDMQPCSECEGTGIITEHVTLRELFGIE